MNGCAPAGCRSPEHHGPTSPIIDPRRPLCESCLTSSTRDIRSLALDFRDLSMNLARQGTAFRTSMVSESAELAVPMRLSVDELMREIAWQLQVWEPPVREAARLSPERTVGVRMGWAVAEAVAVIAPRVDVLAALPPTWGLAEGIDAGPVEHDGVWAVGALVGLHRRARSMLGLTRLITRLPGECSACGATALQRESGSETVQCAVCWEAWTHDDYRRYVGLVAASLRAGNGPEINGEPRSSPAEGADHPRQGSRRERARRRDRDTDRVMP